MTRITGLAVAICTTSQAWAGTAVLDGPGTGPALYAGPHSAYEAIYTAADGTQVETLENTLTWTFVRLPNGSLGWVQSKYLVPVGAYVAAPKPTADIETSVLPAPRPAPGSEEVAVVAPLDKPEVKPVVKPVPKPDIKADDAAIASVPETSGDLIIEAVEVYSSVVWPDAGKLNLRAGPGLGFEVLDQMERGDWVSVSAKAGPWRRVEHESGQKGWAHEAFLTQ